MYCQVLGDDHCLGRKVSTAYCRVASNIAMNRIGRPVVAKTRQGGTRPCTGEERQEKQGEEKKAQKIKERKRKRQRKNLTEEKYSKDKTIKEKTRKQSKAKPSKAKQSKEKKRKEKKGKENIVVDITRVFVLYLYVNIFESSED